MNPNPAPQYGDWYMNPRTAPQYGDWYMNPRPAPQYGDWYMNGNRGKSCTDKTGAVYKDGESWACECNTCRCSNGLVLSTMMGCGIVEYRDEGNPCDQLVGMTVGLAKTVIRNEVVICHGQRIRIRTMRAVSVDGVRQPMTFDYRPSRLDVEIENGKIVKHYRYNVVPF